MPIDFFSKKLLKKTAGQPASAPAPTTPPPPAPIDVRKEAEKLAAAKRGKGKTLADRMNEMQPPKSR